MGPISDDAEDPQDLLKPWRKWVPTEYIGEHPASMRSSPSAWVVKQGGAFCLDANPDDLPGPAEPIPLEDGDEVWFGWRDDLFYAVVTITRDRAVSIEPQLPDGATIICNDDPATATDDIEEFAEIYEWQAGRYAVAVQRWGERVPFVFREVTGTFEPQPETDAGG